MNKMKLGMMEFDVDLHFAESVKDKNIPGIHLFEPSKEQILKAITDAMIKRVKTVVVWSDRKLFKNQ